MNDPVRLIAFYLPQFHPIPENDEWWGKGFTEWTNVTAAKPLFPGHYQPHLPADLGFYDLRLPEARQAQANLARKYGIYGFCYYHYWFNGRRILERPFDEVLASGRPDFPFCLCWANENWTRRWDGLEDNVLLQQNYSEHDDRAHIQSLLPALRDERYIRIDGKALVLVWRTERIPNPERTAEVWREEVARAGLGDLYLARVESLHGEIDPRNIGFDAAVEFAPDWRKLAPAVRHRKRYLPLVKAGVFSRAYLDHRICDYQVTMENMLSKPEVEYCRFRGMTPSWDNTARVAKGGIVLHNATPDRYAKWLSAVVRETVQKRVGDERIVFINAWNEWAEGCHLEPCRKWGRSYLEATRRALSTP